VELELLWLIIVFEETVGWGVIVKLSGGWLLIVFKKELVGHWANSREENGETLAGRGNSTKSGGLSPFHYLPKYFHYISPEIISLSLTARFFVRCYRPKSC
jgi:hypothetical protein